MSASLSIRLAERGLIPDSAIRLGIRQLAKQRINSLPPANGQALEDSTSAFIKALHASPIAVLTDKANEQHYELPAEFFGRVLGPRRKYSSCLFERPTSSLEDAEIHALEETARHAALEDGQTVLELGCGWGSLSLWMAETFPNSRILGVSNSSSQRSYILDRAKALGLTNLEILTCDMNTFSPEGRYDRIVSVEMFEHMRNWHALFTRVADWLTPEGRFFMHVFTHRGAPYLFEVQDASDWMSQYFFSGGMMPSLDLATRIDSPLQLEDQWVWPGTHYQHTANAWLARLDAQRAPILALFATTYGAKDAALWVQRWRIFFMACAELFGYDQGSAWPVGHYRFRKAGPDEG